MFNKQAEKVILQGPIVAPNFRAISSFFVTFAMHKAILLKYFMIFFTFAMLAALFRHLHDPGGGCMVRANRRQAPQGGPLSRHAYRHRGFDGVCRISRIWVQDSADLEGLAGECPEGVLFAEMLLILRLHYRQQCRNK